MKYDFLTIGGATRDISFFTDEGVIVSNRRDVLRQQLLAFEVGAKIKVKQFHYSFGGGAANAAACLANFGLKTACLAAVGDDENGRWILRNLRQRKIATAPVQVVKGTESGSSFILIDPTGERIIFGQKGANEDLQIAADQTRLIGEAKNIYLSSLSGNWSANIRRIFRAVKEKETKVFWNPAAAQYAGGADPIAAYLKKTAVLFLNDDEAIELVVASPGYRHLRRPFLDEPANLARIIHGFGPEIVVITLGRKGVLVYDGQSLIRRPIIKTKRRLDTTGVGDVFNSSFAAGLVSGGIERALDYGLRNAAAKIQHVGAQSGLITK